MSSENSRKLSQDNANCGDFKGRPEDYTDITGGVPKDGQDFMLDAMEDHVNPEEVYTACVKAKEKSPEFLGTWNLPAMYTGPKPSWIRRTMLNGHDISGYKIFIGGLWHVHNRTVADWLKSDASDEHTKKAIALYVKDINVVGPSERQDSQDCKAQALSNLMEGGSKGAPEIWHACIFEIRFVLDHHVQHEAACPVVCFPIYLRPQVEQN